MRGDDDVEETKLTNAIGARDLRPAREEEIRAVGMVPGYASPIGAKGALVVVDELVAASANLVAGANKEGYHVKNVNIPRDFTPDHIVDLASTKAGDAWRRGLRLATSSSLEPAIAPHSVQSMRTMLASHTRS